ncbi:MAG: DUF3263 domain-containing protein [Propionibacteriales bacterium]|nr:DUF3263 domain-containing protein [Propionibacteriales bacterium]
MDELSTFEREILDFESRWWSHGKKSEAIVERFGLKPSTYYVRRSEIAARPEALAYAPVTVRRLRRSNRSKS